ncbi:MAG: hypothetical protein LQ348_001055 [Seirophora lacunosa]|nr:MAG: hypothetical protein LQ348_001055 [Seirophora lacunosa]
MHFNLYLVLGACSFLAIQAQEEVRVGVGGAIRNATDQYSNAESKLRRLKPDCERDITASSGNCKTTFGSVSRDIDKANENLQDAIDLFVPKVNCAYISNEFNTLRENILSINGRLRKFACSTADRTKEAVDLNADAIRSAVENQIVKIDAVSRFALPAREPQHLPSSLNLQVH